MAKHRFSEDATKAVEWIARYRERLDGYPVLARVRPGDVWSRIPDAAPEAGGALDALLEDLDALLVDGLTHWNHPGFFAYFCSSTTDAGVLAELISAELNQNAMVWRTSPAATELEQRMVDWVRRFVRLPEAFSGVILDTASTSTFTALVAARERAVPEARTEGLPGRRDVGPCRVYLSEHAHSSLDKAAVAAGLGLAGLRRIPTDERFAMDPAALERRLAADREAGHVPVMVCATIGTTSTSGVDPVAAIAAVCRRHDVWLHVDAAYAGPAASLPELGGEFAGWELADSIVLNPHKWMATPIDCSVLLYRDREIMQRSMWVKPEYLSSDDAAADLMDVGLALGRRFRALKLWFVFRTAGAEGLRSMLREHIRLTREFAAWIDADPRFELLMPPPFSLCCFQSVPPRGRDAGEWNRGLLAAVNARGPVFLSHTVVGGAYTLRMAIGSARNTAEAVRAAYALLCEEYDRLADGPPPGPSGSPKRSEV